MKANILIIDEDQNILNFLELALSGLDQNIIKCKSGADGLRALLTNEVAVILLDTNMSGLDGYETAKLIKSRTNTSIPLPIIFVAAYNKADIDVSKGYSLGAVDYILFPVNEIALLAKLRVFLDLYFSRKNEQLNAQKLIEVNNELLTINKKLADSEKQFRIVFDRSTVGKSLVLPDGKFLRVNETFASMLGYSVEELQMLNFMKITHHEDISKSVECLRSLLENEQSSYRMTKRYIHKNESIIWVDISATLLRDEADKPLYFITSILDITEIKKAEDKIKQLNDELESFNYSAAHDLRAPLCSIEGFCSLLQDEYEQLLDEQGADYLKWIRKATEKMRLLIEDLLRYACINKIEIQRESVNISEVVKSITNELSNLCPERKAEFIIEDGITIEGDSNLLNILLRNLIENSWKFSKKNKTTLIEFGKINHKDQPVYFVRDNGIGFDMKNVDRIFGAFQRLHGASEFEGTGIGLATVQRIIDKHGGKIWAEAEINKGATFYFKI